MKYEDYTDEDRKKGLDFLKGKTILVLKGGILNEYYVHDITEIENKTFIKCKEADQAWIYINKKDIKQYVICKSSSEPTKEDHGLKQLLKDEWEKKMRENEAIPWTPPPYKQPKPWQQPLEPYTNPYRPFAPEIWCKRECSKCHLNLEGTICYSCPDPQCPVGLGPTMCKTNVIQGDF